MDSLQSQPQSICTCLYQLRRSTDEECIDCFTAHVGEHRTVCGLWKRQGIPCFFKGCISLDPSKISKSGWWGLQLDAWQLCNSLWYGLINSKLHINKKVFFLYHTTSDGVTVQCFKSPSWPLRDGLDLWPQLIYTLSWESQHEEI